MVLAILIGRWHSALAQDNSTSNFQFREFTKNGTGTVTGAYGINIVRAAMQGVLNIGGGIVIIVVIIHSVFRRWAVALNLAVLIGGNNNKIIAGTDACSNVIMGRVILLLLRQTTTYKQNIR